jgi:CelD/BcsL family acetyltransferase involved in cellulose biosynthesis
VNDTTAVPESVRIVDPVLFPGWDHLLDRFPDASIFHGAGWAQILAATYGHRPLYFCRFDRDQLMGVLPVMEIASRWTGKRGASLPFTDVCSPLVKVGQGASDLYSAALNHGRGHGWRYLECRSPAPDWRGSTESVSFYTHVLDLPAAPKELFERMESSVRRGVRKAESAGVRVEFRTDPVAVEIYYQLHCRTRRRQGLPPQPWRFFQNIQQYLLAREQGFIALAFADAQPAAAAVILHLARRAIYKFGASDEKFQHLRPNNLVMWRAIERLRDLGITNLHFGRTSLFNHGLRRYKLGFGAREEQMSYARFDFRSGSFVKSGDRSQTWMNQIFRACPVSVLRLTGRLLYPHIS